MNLQQLLSSLTPDIYANLKRAVELGKWPDGKRLSQEQRELCMQAVIAYEHRHLPPEQHIGYIEPEPHTHCATDEGHDHTDEPLPLKWM
jgi:uncharacterized protein YeaC (DUF1315 family)